MNVKEIAALDGDDFNRMTRGDLMKAANKLVSAVNKRIDRLQNSDYRDSGALEKLIASGKTKFSTAGQNVNQLRRTIKEAKQFYNAKSGSVSGNKKLISDTAKRIAEIGSEGKGKVFEEYMKSEDNRRNFWRAYERAKDKAGSKGFDSERVQERIRKAMEAKITDIDDLSEYIGDDTEETQDEYEARQDKEEVSQSFYNFELEEDEADPLNL